MPTINQVVDILQKSAIALEKTVDTLKVGEGTAEVLGIASVFMPSHDILQRCAARRLNLVIAHEAPFYHHLDQLNVWPGDGVLQAKQQLIHESGLAIFRWHDHIHRTHPDLIVDGLIRDLDWTQYLTSGKPKLDLPLETKPLVIPKMPLRDVVQHIKARLRLDFVRVVGDPEMTCVRVGVLPGYCGGGALAIPYFEAEHLDLIITGEGPEWETPEYVRDALSQGKAKALIVLGHGPSEESGMKYLVDWMRPLLPCLPIEFLAEARLFRLM